MIQATKPKGKIAWCTTPLLNGVTTAYRVVGHGLRQAGWQVQGVTAGRGPSSGLYPGFENDSLEVLLPGSSDVRRNAVEFVRWVRERNIDIVLSTGDAFAVAATPALPSKVRFVYRCPSITRYTYSIAVANPERTDKIIAASPRQCNDLAREWGVPPEKCVLIPLGVEVEKFAPPPTMGLNGPIRLIFLGRLDENSKAILTLAEIAANLGASSVDFHLDIIGDGPDGGRLQEALRRARLSGNVTFHGALEHSKTVPLLQAGHVLLLPSRYESQSWALLEAMACGCVPVASRIAGVTDFPIQHGANGFLCSVGKSSEFSSAVAYLSQNRDQIEKLSKAARQVVTERFSAEGSGALYDALFSTLLAQVPGDRAPIPLSKIELPKIFDAGLRRFIPQTMKNRARNWAERFHISV